MAPDTIQMQSDSAGKGPALAVVGGGLTGWASWLPFVPRLAHRRRVIRLQPLGVQLGLEDRPLPADYSIKTESRALAAALDAQGVTAPVDIAAWSFGALVTLDFALDHPERIRHLCLIEPPAVWTLPDHGRGDPELRRLEATFPDPRAEISEDMLASFLEIAGFVAPGQTPRALPQWAAFTGHRRSLRNTAAVFAHDDDRARLRAFDRPVLIATGTGTSRFLRAIVDTLATELPNVRVVEMPAGHAPHLVSTERFLAELDAFLAS